MENMRILAYRPTPIPRAAGVTKHTSLLGGMVEVLLKTYFRVSCLKKLKTFLERHKVELISCSIVYRRSRLRGKLRISSYELPWPRHSHGPGNTTISTLWREKNGPPAGVRGLHRVIFFRGANVWRIKTSTVQRERNVSVVNASA